MSLRNETVTKDEMEKKSSFYRSSQHKPLIDVILDYHEPQSPTIPTMMIHENGTIG